MSAGPFLFAKSGVLNKKRSLAPLPFTSGVRIETLNVGRTFFVFKVRSFKQKAVSRAPSISRFSEKSNSENLGISVFPNFQSIPKILEISVFPKLWKFEKMKRRVYVPSPPRQNETAALRFTAKPPRCVLRRYRRAAA
jgi:hypothetical protein